MSSSFEPPRSGGGSSATSGSGRAESIRDAIPDAEPLHGAHDTYAKGEVSSIGALIGDISSDFSTLMRQEVALAKAEVKDSATKAGKGAGMLAGAGYAGHMVALFLSIALWWALSHLVGHSWSALIVAVIWGIVAAVLASRGRKELKKIDFSGLKRINPKPEQTVDTLQQVPSALKPN